jgi:hypothetical protein
LNLYFMAVRISDRVSDLLKGVARFFWGDLSGGVVFADGVSRSSTRGELTSAPPIRTGERFAFFGFNERDYAVAGQSLRGLIGTLASVVLGAGHAVRCSRGANPIRHFLP